MHYWKCLLADIKFLLAAVEFQITDLIEFALLLKYNDFS